MSNIYNPLTMEHVEPVPFSLKQTKEILKKRGLKYEKGKEYEIEHVENNPNEARITFASAEIGFQFMACVRPFLSWIRIDPMTSPGSLIVRVKRSKGVKKNTLH